MNREDEIIFSNDTATEITEQYGFKLINITSCRKIWRIKTNIGYHYLKRTRLNQNDLWYIYEALEYLFHNGFQNIPRFICAKTGEPFATHWTGLYILTDWHFGTELDFRTLMDLKQATRLMAEFHLKSAGFEPRNPQPHRTNWLEWPTKLQERLLQLQEFRRLANLEKEYSTFSRLYLRHFEPCYRQAVSSYEAILNSPYQEVAQEAFLKKSFCHHDYSGRNILRTYSEQLILVDFDYCLSDLRIHDLINLLVRNLRHNRWNIELCNFILKEYQFLYPLPQNELEVMYILLCWPQDFWQVGLQYYDEKLPWPKERFIKKLEHKISYRLERNRFLTEFANSIHSH